jgi:hypothetical protein
LELGVAATIGIEVLPGEQYAKQWLGLYPDKEIIDIKFSASGTTTSILIIYRKD